MKLATALVLASLMAPIHQNHPTGPVAAKVCGPEDWRPHAHPPREALSSPLSFGPVGFHALGCPYTITPPPRSLRPKRPSVLSGLPAA
jgi:hypothetical protein